MGFVAFGAVILFVWGWAISIFGDRTLKELVESLIVSTILVAIGSGSLWVALKVFLVIFNAAK
jgi:hypothetical protein